MDSLASSGNLETAWTENYLTLCLSIVTFVHDVSSEHSSKYQKMLKLCNVIAALLYHTILQYITTNETLQGIVDDVRLSLLILAYHRQSSNGLSEFRQNDILFDLTEKLLK